MRKKQLINTFMGEVGSRLKSPKETRRVTSANLVNEAVGKFILQNA